jgi:hypothetical protein
MTKSIKTHVAAKASDELSIEGLSPSSSSTQSSTLVPCYRGRGRTFQRHRRPHRRALSWLIRALTGGKQPSSITSEMCQNNAEGHSTILYNPFLDSRNEELELSLPGRQPGLLTKAVCGLVGLVSRAAHACWSQLRPEVRLVDDETVTIHSRVSF